MSVHKLPLPAPVSDPDAIWELRNILRNAFIQAGKLPQRDATVRLTREKLDDMISDLSTELDSIEPEFQLRLRQLEVWR